MTLPTHAYCVTDLEESDEEELLKTLLERALAQSPKLLRGTSTIKEWMTIIEQNDDLKQLLPLNSAQRLSLETYAETNKDMELDINHIMCMYSMILKSKPLDSPSSSLLHGEDTRKSFLKGQQKEQALSPSSPTPGDRQPQRTISSTSRGISTPSPSPLLERTDVEDVSLKPQSKGKKVSINLTSLRNNATQIDSKSDDDDDDDAYSKHNVDEKQRLKQENNTCNGIEESKRESATNNASPNHPAWKDTLTPLDANQANRPTIANSRTNDADNKETVHSIPQCSNSNTRTTSLSPRAERECDQQQTDDNAILLEVLMRDMEMEIHDYREKISDYEQLKIHHQRKTEEMQAHTNELKKHIEDLDQQYQRLAQTSSNDIQQLNQAIQHTRLELEEAKEDLLDTQHSKSQLEQAIAKVQEEYALCKMRLEEKSDELASVKKEMNLYKDTLAAMEVKLVQKDEELDKTKKSIEERSLGMTMTTEKIQDTLKKLAQLEKEKGTCSALVNDTTRELAEMTEKYKSLQRNVEEMKKQQQQSSSRQESRSFFSFWNRMKTSTHEDNERLKSLYDQLNAQSTMIEQLRADILSNSESSVLSLPVQNKVSHWSIVALGIVGSLLFVGVLSLFLVVRSEPASYGLWNDPHGYQGQWISNAPVPKTWYLAMLDHLLLPRNHTLIHPV